MRIAPLLVALFGMGGLTLCRRLPLQILTFALPISGFANVDFERARDSGGPVPIYVELPIPDKANVADSTVVFDAATRLHLGGHQLHSYDGSRWQRAAIPGIQENRLLTIDADRRLWFHDYARLGFVELSPTGAPADAISWVSSDFLEEGAPFPPWYARAFDGEGVYFILGGSAWYWSEGEAKELLARDVPILFPFEWKDRWHLSDGQGRFLALGAEGALPVLSRRLQADTSILWARDSENPPGIEVGTWGGMLRLTEDAVHEVELPELESLLDAGWYIGSATAAAGWTAVLTHTRGFFVFPEGASEPVHFEAPTASSHAGRGNRSYYFSFDRRGNLWLNTDQGLLVWENPGAAWRWLPRGLYVEAIDTTASGLVVRGPTSILGQVREGRFGRAELQTEEGEFVLGGHPLDEGWLLSSRGFLWQHGAYEERARSEAPEDLEQIIAVPGSEEAYLVFGTSQVYLCVLSDTEPPSLVPIYDLEAPVVEALSMDEEIHFADTRGATFRMRLAKTAPGGYRVAHVQALRGWKKRGAPIALTRWGDAVLRSTADEMALLLPGSNTFEPLPQFEGFEIIAATAKGRSGQFVALREAGAERLVFADWEGSPSRNFEPNWRWYPGTMAVGRLNAIGYDPSFGGELWLGGNDGLISIAESVLRPVEELPPVHLAYSLDNGQHWEVAGTEALSLPYSHPTLQFRWFVEDWYTQAPAVVETRMEGIMDDWHEPTSATVAFTGLRENAYSFAVRLTDVLGREHHRRELSFVIQPPWYRSWGAWTAYAVILLLAVAGAFRLYSYRERIRREYLERIVRKRTEELEHANAVKSEFVANMSHELRNPMNGVAGIAELLTHGTLSAEQSRLIKTLRSCSEQLSRMINDILDFAKLEAGRLSLEKRPFNAPAMVDKVIEITSWDVSQSSHFVRKEERGEAPFLVIGDDAKISQILINFISNACKYADAGEICVRSLYGAQMSNRILWRLEVSDHGPGLTEGERARLFERFYRSPRTAAGGSSGSGLGLAVCAELAELMGGRVGSVPNREGGSCFFLELSLPLPEGTSQDLARIDYDRDYIGTVLVVDDMDYNRVVAAGILSSLGFTVTSVSTGNEAIESLVTADYDFAFIDFELPDTTGPEILHSVRAAKGGLSTRCFAVTAYAGKEKREQCQAAGFLGFVTKPISRLKMREALISSGLDSNDLSTGAYQQALSPPDEESYDLEALLILAHGSMDRLMERCEEYIRILRQEVGEAEALIVREPENRTAITKRLHRLTSHGSIVKAGHFMAAVEALRRAIKEEGPEGWKRPLQDLDEQYRTLAINLRRVVDEYRSRA